MSTFLVEYCTPYQTQCVTAANDVQNFRYSRSVRCCGAIATSVDNKNDETDISACIIASKKGHVMENIIGML